MHSPLTQAPFRALASMVVMLALLTTGCSRNRLAVKSLGDAGTQADRPGEAGTDTMAVVDTASEADEAKASICELVDTKRDPIANLVSDPSGCPVALADLPARCGQNPAQLVRCRDYVQVDFPPDPPGGERPGKSTCYYTPDGVSLLGGWVVSTVYAEDAFATAAGKLPQGCEGTCGAVESVCPGQQVIDGSTVD